MVNTHTPSRGKRIWKADKRFGSGVMALGIIGGISQFIFAIIGGLAYGFVSSVEETTGEAMPGVLGLPAEVSANVVIICGIAASLCALTGAAMNRGAPKASFFLLWAAVILGIPTPGPTVLVLIAAIIHTVGVRRASTWEA